MTDEVITFTKNTFDQIAERQEDWGWVLNERRAKSCKYLVCCHSGGAKMGSAFLVGKISGVRFERKDPDSGKNRWAIQVSEVANIDVPDVWQGWQNPVHYSSLSELEIDLQALEFVKPTKNGLTIAQAKEGLATYYDVSPENIEIAIKA